MLKEVELIVLCLHIEVRAIDVHRPCRTSTERRVGKDDIDQSSWLFLQGVIANDWTAVCAHTMQVKVHGSECDHKWCVVNTMQGLVAEEITLCLVLRLMLHIVVGSKEETACATGRVAYRLSNLRTDAIHHSLNERTWGKILSCATLFILSVLLQDALINSTFHVAIHDKPLFLVNHRNDLLRYTGLSILFCALV